MHSLCRDSLESPPALKTASRSILGWPGSCRWPELVRCWHTDARELMAGSCRVSSAQRIEKPSDKGASAHRFRSRPSIGVHSNSMGLSIAIKKSDCHVERPVSVATGSTTSLAPCVESFPYQEVGEGNRSEVYPPSTYCTVLHRDAAEGRASSAGGDDNWQLKCHEPSIEAAVLVLTGPMKTVQSGAGPSLSLGRGGRSDSRRTARTRRVEPRFHWH